MQLDGKCVSYISVSCVGRLEMLKYVLTVNEILVVEISGLITREELYTDLSKYLDRRRGGNMRATFPMIMENGSKNY